MGPGREKFMDERIAIVIEMIKSFTFAGLELTMTTFNKAGKVPPACKGLRFRKKPSKIIAING